MKTPLMLPKRSSNWINTRYRTKRWKYPTPSLIRITTCTLVSYHLKPRMRVYSSISHQQVRSLCMSRLYTGCFFYWLSSVIASPSFVSHPILFNDTSFSLGNNVFQRKWGIDEQNRMRNKGRRRNQRRQPIKKTPCILCLFICVVQFDYMNSDSIIFLRCLTLKSFIFFKNQNSNKLKLYTASSKLLKSLSRSMYSSHNLYDSILKITIRQCGSVRLWWSWLRMFCWP